MALHPSFPVSPYDPPLPERYRFLLFEDKREVELVWNGKSRDVCTAILPFQTLEHIDEPRKETGIPPNAVHLRIFPTTTERSEMDELVVLNNESNGQDAHRSKQ